MLAIEHPDLKLRVVPQTPRFGAVVEGCNAKEPLTNEVVNLLVDLLMEFKVLIFPNQGLSISEHQRFANFFGTPFFETTTPQVDPISAPGIVEFEVVSFFHSDLMYQEEPPDWSLLQVDTVPPVGGDTLWSDLVSSYEDLSEPMRAFLDPLVAVHCTEQHEWTDEMMQDSYLNFDRAKGGRISEERLAELRRVCSPREHPLVRTIPESGRKNYWVSKHFTRSIVGLSESESSAVLSLLYAHQLQPKYIFRWRWSPGDLAFFDQRTTVHVGVRDYPEGQRHCRRASIRRPRPS